MTGNHRSQQPLSVPSQNIPQSTPIPTEYTARQIYRYAPKSISKKVTRSILISGASWISAIFVFTYVVILTSAPYTGSWFQEWFVGKYSTEFTVIAIVFPIAFLVGTLPNVRLRRSLPQYAHTEVTIIMLKIIMAFNIVALALWCSGLVVLSYRIVMH